ncbi:MAG: GT4 family glycosyltransferase PelF [Gammaproteobacteria bacterium]|nr:GT4 family glycosyltransferase PelF [Gammaproteobacteria bacterium]
MSGPGAQPIYEEKIIHEAPADICVLLEGTYPYVAGGVSSWTHDLMRTLPHLKFALVTLMPPGAPRVFRYEMPDNVVSLSTVTLQQLLPGKARMRGMKPFFKALEQNLVTLTRGGGLESFRGLMGLLAARRESLGQRILLDSRESWQMLTNMFQLEFADSSFLDYFWSWRALLGGLYSALLGPLPAARVYHTVSTGYAGLYAARAAVETGRPVFVTEHGIYTNERRIEIAMADWLHELPLTALGIEPEGRDLKDFWIAAFASYSLVCYQACHQIVTLYEGNFPFQTADGADPDKLRVIPNGINWPRFQNVQHCREGRRPQIALIGRVVPIKDVKTYIRACGILKKLVPEVHCYMMGPTEEDEDYYADCVALAEQQGLGDSLEFTGRVRIDDYLGQIDVMVLTSISEAQPLVLLEAGAVGIPSVATDVGACREMLFGRADEDPPLGPAGAITQLADPEATALAIARLLTDDDWYRQCSGAIRARVERYYQERDVARTYGELYANLMDMPDDEQVKVA